MSNELLGGLIGGGAAIIASLFVGVFDLFYKWCTRPMLKLDYEGFLVTSNYKIDDQQVSQIFARARIQNIGQRVARNCRVFLTNIQEVQKSGLLPTTFQDSMALSYPRRDFLPRDIPKGITFYVDVVSVFKHVKAWEFGVKSLYASQEGLVKYPGTYRLTLIATAEDAEPVEFQIDARYNMDWHNFRAWVAGAIENSQQNSP